MMPPNLRPMMRGVSLIEVLIASAILIIGLSGIAMGLTNLSRQQEHQRFLAGAHTVAGNAMEELVLRQDTNTLPPGTTTDQYDGKGRISASGPFIVTRTVTHNNPMPDGRMIEVRVQWDERGVAKEYKLKTYAYVPPP